MLNLFDFLPDIQINESNVYIGTDGLKYCCKCKAPKQVKITLLDKEEIKPCSCKCEMTAYWAERKRLEDEKTKTRISTNRDICFSGELFYKLKNATFEADNHENNNEKIMRSLKDYVDNFPEMMKDNCGVLIYGNVGTGKSFAAACVANALIDKEYTVKMTNFTVLSNELWGTNKDRQAFIDNLVSYDLLILDDLGVERNSEYMNQIVTSVLDARYCTSKPLIVTTNLSGTELFGNSNTDINRQRIYSRLTESCIPIMYTGYDRRTRKMQDKISKYKQMLELGT